MAKRKTIWVSRVNPNLNASQLREFGYGGKTAKDVLKNIKKHYPKAHFNK